MAHRPIDATERAALVEALRVELEADTSVVFAYLHGSVLEPVGFRDVDVAIWLDGSAPQDLDLEIGRRLSLRTGLAVDVRQVNDAPGSFLFHVLRGVPLIVRDERFVADLIERVAREYHDLAPLRRRAVHEAFVA